MSSDLHRFWRENNTWRETLTTESTRTLYSHNNKADGFRKFLKDSPFDVMLANAGGRCMRSRKLHLSPVCTIFLQKLWPINITLYSFNLKLCLSHNKRLLLLLFCFFSFVFYCEITVLPPCGTTDYCRINFMCVLVITEVCFGFKGTW